MKISIIGVGVVGGALLSIFKKFKLEVFTYDKYKEDYPFSEAVLQSDIIFVCVPTPTINFTPNLVCLKEALELIALSEFKGVTVIKSTVLPGTCDEMHKLYPKLKLVHHPEFLTEKSPSNDFLTEKNILLTGRAVDCSIVDNFYTTYLGERVMSWSHDFKVSEMAKYMHNTMLAAKVALCNEIYLACQESKVDYEQVRKMAVSIGKIGPSHTLVPGDNKQFGYGGNCFLKDMKAFIGKYDLKIFKTIHVENEKHRKQVQEEKWDNLGY